MSRSKETDTHSQRKQYQVGYRKPPKHRRFKRGQSGNPSGRPKGARNFKTDLKATLKIPVKVTRAGRPRHISTQQAALLRLRERALSGVTRELLELIVLAQSYNNEELTVSRGLSASDQNILEIFKARVLSGAAAAYESAKTQEKPIEGGPSPKSSPLHEETTTVPIKRVRLSERVRLTDARKVANENRSDEDDN
jgi:hypothetical protein